MILMEPPSKPPSSQPVGDRLFDEYAFVNLTASGQIDSYRSLLDVEEGKYLISAVDCNLYRQELDAAAGEDETGAASQNSDWRYRIARWMLRASDEFEINRETAIIALLYTDRFLLGKKISRNLLQVAAVTCLLVASKLFEKKPIKVPAMMSYTQGKFDAREVLSMEKELVNAIGSFMYPPTAGTFVLMLLNEFSCASSAPAVLDTCQFMIELASCDFFFVARKQSSLAAAAIMLTMEQMHLKVPPVKPALDCANDVETIACVDRLRRIYAHNDMRIKAIDGEATGIVTAELSDRKRACRAATPSPTPEDEQKQATFGSTNDDNMDGTDIQWTYERDGCNQDNGGDRKRQKCEVSIGVPEAHK